MTSGSALSGIAGIAGKVRRLLGGGERLLPIHVSHYENVLGTSLEIKIRAASRAIADDAERRAQSEIDRLEAIFSSFNPKSEFRRWQENRGISVPISPELSEVLNAADRWHEGSGGAFHPASEAYTRLWKEAAQKDRCPTEAELAALRERVNASLWELNPADGTAVCKTDCPLTLNALAKGYIVDRAADAAYQPEEGITQVVLNIGGDLRLRGDRDEWVGVANPDQDAENAPPFTQVRVQNGAVATSGDWRRGFRIGESFYSHLLDPRTGWSVDHIRSASALAPTAADADALATILSVLAPEESLALTDRLPGFGCLLIAKDGSVYRSAGWREREAL